MMLSNLFRNTLPKILLGRWERTPEKLSSVKIRLANIDHCGSCSITKPQPQSVKPITTHALQPTKECDGALMIVNRPSARKEDKKI